MPPAHSHTKQTYGYLQPSLFTHLEATPTNSYKNLDSLKKAHFKSLLDFHKHCYSIRQLERFSREVPQKSYQGLYYLDFS